MEYKIVFTGNFNDHLSHQQIKENLMNLFQASQEDIEERFFSGNKTIIAENLEEDEADNYVKLIRHAGAGVSKELQIDLDMTPEPIQEKAHVHKSIYGFNESNVFGSDLSQVSIEEKDPNEKRASIPETYRIGGIAADPDIKVKYKKPSRSYMPLFTTNIRTGRLRFLSRLLAFFILPQLAFLAVILFQPDLYTKLIGYFGEMETSTSVIIIAVVIFIYLSYLGIILIQRLNDLNIGSKGLIILLLPIVILTFSFASLKVGQLQSDQRNQAAGVVNALAIHSGKRQHLDDQAMNAQISQADIKFVKELRWVLNISFIISTLMLLAMIVLPGSKDTNDFADPAPQIGIFSFIFLIFGLGFVAQDYLGPKFLPQYYSKIEEQTDYAIFQAVVKTLAQHAPLPEEVKEELSRMTKEDLLKLQKETEAFTQ